MEDFYESDIFPADHVYSITIEFGFGCHKTCQNDGIQTMVKLFFRFSMVKHIDIDLMQVY